MKRQYATIKSRLEIDKHLFYFKMSLKPIKISFKNNKVTAIQAPMVKPQSEQVEIECMTNELGKLTITSKRAAVYKEFDSVFAQFENKMITL